MCPYKIMLFVIYILFLLNNELLTNCLAYAINDEGICKKSEYSELCAFANLTDTGKIRKKRNFELTLTPLQMIKREGYPAEKHSDVETPDGYLLTLHRIPRGRGERKGKNKPVALLMHGIELSSAAWILFGPKIAIAYQLADEGYDVWMGNARGNTWSRKHIMYNPNRDSEFWDFSWDEIATIDLPTMIDYILKKTGQKKMYFFGQSQGTTVIFVLLAEKPEYNDKIKLVIALAPVAYMSRIANAGLQLAAAFHDPIGWFSNVVGYDEFFPNNPVFHLIGKLACNDQSAFQSICAHFYYFMFGRNPSQLNRTMLPEVLSQFPAGASLKQLLHYLQEIESGRFCRFDHGVIKNLFRYKLPWPPDYRIKNIVAPIAMFYSENDYMADVSDVRKFMKQLPNLAMEYLVPEKTFSHMDFVFGIDAKKLVNDVALKLMKKYK